MATTHKGIPLNGRIADDIEYVPAANGKKTRATFGIIENDYQYVDGELQRDGSGHPITTKTIYHPVVVYDRLAERVAETLQRGDAVLAVGDLEFDTYKDATTDRNRTSHSFVLRSIGPSLSGATVEVQRQTAGASRESAPSQGPDTGDVWNSPSPPAVADGRSSRAKAGVGR